MLLKDSARRSGLDYRTIYQFITLVADLGIIDGIRLVLREFGIHTYQSMKYPGRRKKYHVQFDPVWRWIGRGTRECGVLKFFQERIREGDIVFDLGAHVGEYTLLFSELVGPSGRVIAFDADPIAFEILRRNLQLNNISNVTIEQRSTDKTGKTLLVAERFGSGLSSTTPSQLLNDAHYKTLEVESTTIDDYCETHNIVPSWIKIDTEGAEPLIINGMSRLIEAHHPQVILEFHHYNLTAEQRDEAWSTIMRRAVSVQALENAPKKHEYLEELSKEHAPEYGFLVVYIQY